MKPLLFALLLAPAAQAATYTVTRFDDPAPNGCVALDCSLREAVLAANAAAGSDTVVLGSGTYVLRQPGLATPVTVAIDSGIAFTGAGRDLTRIEGRGRGSLFSVSGVKVSFAGLTLAKGNATWASTSAAGGAIRVSFGVVRLTGVRVSENRATDGGGLHLAASTLELVDTLVEDNVSEHDGGGVLALASTLRLRSASAVRDNVAGWGGGGIAANGDVLGDDDCEISGNVAKRGGGVMGHGGALVLHGVATAGGDGLFDITDNLADDFDSTFHLPVGHGGGLYTHQDLDLRNVAITANQSNAAGGGVVVSGGTLALRDSYIANNYAAQSGGGARISSTRPMLIERVGFDGNVSGLYGGAMQLSGATGNTPTQATLRNVDFHGNHAAEDGALYNSTELTMAHVTFWNNTENSGAAAIAQGDSGSTHYFNSLVLGRCTRNRSDILGQGINVKSQESDGTCDGVTVPAPLLLSRGDFGGDFPITGTDSPASGIIAMGRRNLCIADDIRGRARDAECDVGAFEYIAPANRR